MQILLKNLGRDKREYLGHLVYVLGGCLLFAVAVNMVIVPIGIYSGGTTGVIQLIRTLLLDVLKLHMPKGIDLAGIINFSVNIPLLYMAYRVMGKEFFAKTLCTVVILSTFLALIPVLDEPIITDYLTACLVGGIMAGTGAGMILRGKSCGGGSDILGICCTKLFDGFSVGKMSILLNIVIFSIYMVFFDMEIVIYSFIYTVVCAISLDRAHIQNINVSVMIFTKKEGIAETILEKMRRGVTNWDGVGAYTQKEASVLYVIISKYEENQLRKIVHSIDPDAFMVFNEGCTIDGNFEKRL